MRSCAYVERHFTLVGVLEAVGHDLVTTGLQFVPQPEIPDGPAVIFVGQHKAGQVGRRDHVDARRNPCFS